jgi:hypothetical protein
MQIILLTLFLILNYFCLVTQLRIFIKHPVLFPLLLPLLNNISSRRFWNSIIMEDFRVKCIGHSRQYEQLPREFLLNKIQATSKFAFGILNGSVWRIDLEKMLSNNSDELNNYNDEIIEGWSGYLNLDIGKKTYEHLFYIHLCNPFMDTINAIFQRYLFRSVVREQNLIRNLIKWEIKISTYCRGIELQVFKKTNVNSEWNLICTRIDDCNDTIEHIYRIKLLNDNYIVILATIGLFIYHFNENNISISLEYFYHMDLSLCSFIMNKERLFYHYKKIFSTSILPLPNHDSFKFCDGWVSYIKDNKEILLKYGVELFTFAIKEHKINLIDDIFKKCINYFKEDLSNNRMFLSIITSTMPLLNDYFPEYIYRYSLKTSMIIDSPSYNIKHQNSNSHLCSFFQYNQLVNLTQSILWLKYKILKLKLFEKCKNIETIMYIIYVIFPHIGKISSTFSNHITTPTITFMNPYINFVNYPQDYNWFSEIIRPQPSPFVKTINRDIYKTWNGETLINFKWNTYGKHYYITIWIVFIIFNGCFTASATIPNQYINGDVQKYLLIISIILGFIHINFEIRQIIYNWNKWIHDFWNIFGKYK